MKFLTEMTEQEAHYAFWETAGWMAAAVIVAIGIGGLLLAAREIGRWHRGRR